MGANELVRTLGRGGFVEVHTVEAEPDQTGAEATDTPQMIEMTVSSAWRCGTDICRQTHRVVVPVNAGLVGKLTGGALAQRAVSHMIAPSCTNCPKHG